MDNPAFYGDRASKEYWDNRVLELKDNEYDMIWAANSGFRKAHEDITKKVLNMFRDCTVVDVACGFGRFCNIFKPQNYFGFDFSDEMIKLAKTKHSLYRFEVQDYNKFEAPEADVFFNVISVGSMGINHQKFFEKYKNKAKKAIVSIDGTSIMIYPIQ